MLKTQFSVGGAWVQCVLIFLFAVAAQAQAPTPGAQVLKSPDALMLEAARLNGLSGNDLQPWHIKLTFKIAEDLDHPIFDGTYEEFWVSPTRYKREFVSSSFSQVEYGNSIGIRRKGLADDPPKQLQQLVKQFVNPISLDEVSLANSKLNSVKRTAGSVALNCLTVIPNPTPGTDRDQPSTYCVSDNEPVLRLSFLNGSSSPILRNNIVKFNGRYLPKQIVQYFPDPSVSAGGSPRVSKRLLLTALLDSAELVNTIEDAAYTPPPNAVAPTKVVTLPEEKTRSHLVRHPSPSYPPIARAARVSGNVILSAMIRTDGQVSDLQVISGPAMLQGAALDGVKNWTFSPFIAEGGPVEVKTTITVVYPLGN